MTIVVFIAIALGAQIITAPGTLRGTTMGTTYHIKYVSTDTAPPPDELHANVETILGDVDRQMSTYRRDSELSRFNRAAPGKWFSVSPATAAVASASLEISRKTDGALDVTVGPLVSLWHFAPPANGKSSAEGAFRPPSDSELRSAREFVGYERFVIRRSPPALRKDVAGLEVDLSSIASGYTIDRLAEMLRNHGIKNFMVELGGEVRAEGRRADGRPWRVGVERPLVATRRLQLAVPLENASIATAGGTRKFFEYAGQRYSHIIDPASGRPIEHSLDSVTVVADTCIDADGWDTPLLVMGPRRGFECAKKHGIAALFISNGGKTVRATPAWSARFGNMDAD